MKNKATAAQKLMIADGFPAELFIPQDVRSQAWKECPPKAMGVFSDAKIEEQRAVREQLKKEETERRIMKLKAGQRRKVLKQIDTRGMRWDPRRNQWEPDPTQEETEMPKWKITSYDAQSAIVPRGSTSIEAGASQVEVFAKMGAAYHRAAAGVVKKMIVTDPAGGLIREWSEEGGSALPKPVPENADKTIKKAKEKGEKRVAKEDKPAKSKPAKATKEKKPAAEKKPKGPGVISTILELARRTKGATVNEMLDALVKVFPDRNKDSMRSTVRTQAGRNCKAGEKDEKRGGTIYFVK